MIKLLAKVLLNFIVFYLAAYIQYRITLKLVMGRLPRFSAFNQFLHFLTSQLAVGLSLLLTCLYSIQQKEYLAKITQIKVNIFDIPVPASFIQCLVLFLLIIPFMFRARDIAFFEAEIYYLLLNEKLIIFSKIMEFLQSDPESKAHPQTGNSAEVSIPSDVSEPTTK